MVKFLKKLLGRPTVTEEVLAYVESIPDGVAHFDQRNIVVIANSKFCKLWNISPSILLGMGKNELHFHQITMLSDPKQDARFLSIESEQSSTTEAIYIQLKSGKWYERRVFDHIVQGACLGHVVQWRDVTARHNALVLLQAERDLLHSMMDSVPHQIYFKDTESRFTRVNKALATRYGLIDTKQAIGKSDTDFYSAEHAAQTRREELEIMSKLIPQINQLHHEVWDDGTDAWNVSTKMPLIDSKGNVIGVYGIAHDITEQKRSETVFWRQANFDALTNLPNRRLLLDRWQQAAHQQRRTGSSSALILIDLDNFKEVNDQNGHAVGDELLVQAVTRMSKCIRASDTLARLGGDEFVVILNGVSDYLIVKAIVDEIRDCLTSAFELSGNNVMISGSLGVSICPSDGDELEDLLSKADKAMYQAKRKGGNAYVFFSKD